MPNQYYINQGLCKEKCFKRLAKFWRSTAPQLASSQHCPVPRCRHRSCFPQHGHVHGRPEPRGPAWFHNTNHHSDVLSSQEQEALAADKAHTIYSLFNKILVTHVNHYNLLQSDSTIHLMSSAYKFSLNLVWRLPCSMLWFENCVKTPPRFVPVCACGSVCACTPGQKFLIFQCCLNERWAPQAICQWLYF